MRVRVGIVSWNTASLLNDCLTALPLALGSLDAEVVVVDNASSDSSAEVAEAHGVKVIRNDGNLGYSRAMNQALAGTGAEVLIALNPDTLPGPGSLERLVLSLMDGPPDIGLVVPALVNTDGSPQHSVRRFPSVRVYAVVWFVPYFLHRGNLARRFWLEGRAPHDRECDIDWAIGAVHVIRSAALAGPPYDERWFMYVEDLDFCWSLKQRGWRRRLVPSVEIVHVGNAAGAQAWGRQRFRRFMRPSYLWYADRRGALKMRAWAGLNVVGTTWWVVRRMGASVLRRRRNEVKAALVQLRDEIPVHVEAFLAGPRRDEPGSVASKENPG